MTLAPNFLGINCLVNDTTLITTSGYPGPGFSGGAYSQSGYLNVTVSAVMGTYGSSAMLIGLNTTSSLPLSNGNYNWSAYQLYFHSDSGNYQVRINGIAVLNTSFAPANADIGSITYNGINLVFAINGVQIYTYILPQSFVPLYVTWTSYYSRATTTLTVTPQMVVSPNVNPYEDLVTSEHNQKPNFMSVVDVVVGAAADSVIATQNIIPSFNLDTAVGAQLDILGLWIGQSRVIPGVLVTGFFGFSEYSTGNPDGLQEPFGELTNLSIGGIWFNLGQANSGTTILSDVAYLTILKAKIVKNQWNGTLSGIEAALQYILGVNCSVADNGTLNLTINVPLPVTPLEEALLTSLDLLPRPAGVIISSITFAH